MPFTEGVFSSGNEIGEVIPQSKANDPMSFFNYGPVSVLAWFSELLRRLMYNQLLSFMN